MKEKEMNEKWRTFKVVHDWNDFEFTMKLKDCDLTKQLCKEMIEFFYESSHFFENEDVLE